jgi:hypothetical protein
MYSEPQSLDISAGDILQNALLLLLLLLLFTFSKVIFAKHKLLEADSILCLVKCQKMNSIVTFILR